MNDSGQIQFFAVTAQGVQSLPVPAGAKGFDSLYNDLPVGVYSALRTFAHHKFLDLEAHLARLVQSIALLGWDFDLNRDQFCRALHEVCMGHPWADARVRFDVLAEPAPALGTTSRILIALMPFTPVPAHFYEEGVAAVFAPDLSRPTPLAKTADFAIERRSYTQAAGRQDTYEYLMVDEAGYILEGVGSNFYGVRDGVVWTAGTAVLEGIARKRILELLPQLGIPLRLEAVHVDELARLDEAALSSSSRALLPIVRVGDQVIGEGRPGPVCQRILAAYQAVVQEVVKTAVADLDDS